MRVQLKQILELLLKRVAFRLPVLNIRFLPRGALVVDLLDLRVQSAILVRKRILSPNSRHFFSLQMLQLHLLFLDTIRKLRQITLQLVGLALKSLILSLKPLVLKLQILDLTALLSLFAQNRILGALILVLELVDQFRVAEQGVFEL